MSVENFKCCINEENLQQCINWALKPAEILNITDEKKKELKSKNISVTAYKIKLKEDEKKWGNKMINQDNNSQWTTKLGEDMCACILKNKGESPKHPKKKNGFKPDLETEKYIYEIKTRNWCTSGTAGEKVFGTFVKYQDIPELYGKPLKIICVGYQEYEFTYGKINYFGKNVSEKTKQALKLAKTWGIEYVPFSKFILNSK